ncbi:hypothetical protein BCR36DRAFT_406405 [Piromyces finnis]|uniref:Uncharacterized protein n=1 Tax=Piromyces finnis TaxID=1754191 RepID=A0A1Y1V1C1_9FUNG|nr:hypothetical protein BCR36DRAFT_406405 [Piromyces finnis]|eukprot:ORX44310.1 hypothetical protein BCR36DRAFT_406405 [Piromyces finnis]
MASSNFFFQHDEDNPFINRDKTSRITKSKNTDTINYSILNNTNKNKRHIPNDISMESDSSSTLIQESNELSYYQNPNNKKRLKVNNQIQNDITFSEKENNKNEKLINNIENIINNNGGRINKNNIFDFSIASTSQVPSMTEPILIEDISNTNSNVTETENESYLNTPSKRPTERNNKNKSEIVVIEDNSKYSGKKNKDVEIDSSIVEDNSNEHSKEIENSDEHLTGEKTLQVETQNKSVQSIRSQKLEKALEMTIKKINRLVSYKRFRQCFPTLCSNNRDDMKDVHKQMALYFSEALKDEFQIIFKKFEMDKNLLLIDECCKQGKKFSQNDTQKKSVNIIYNRVGPDTIIRSNSVNIKKKQLEELKAYYNELLNDKSLDEWVSLNNEKKKYKESIEEYLTYLSKNIEIMKKNDDY